MKAFVANIRITHINIILYEKIIYKICTKDYDYRYLSQVCTNSIWTIRKWPADACGVTLFEK